MSVSATPAAAEDLQSQVQNPLDKFQVEYSLPGATAAYGLPDTTTGTVATGLADVEAEERMTPESRILAASIGKSMRCSDEC